MSAHIPAVYAYAVFKRFVRALIIAGPARSIFIEIMGADISADCALMIFIICVGEVHSNCCVFTVCDGYTAVCAAFIDPSVAGDGMVIVVSRFGSAFCSAFVPETAGYFHMLMRTGVYVAAL